MTTLALITGATSGIGEALAKRLASAGIPLLLTGRNNEKLELLQRELSRLTTVQTFSADLATPEGRALVVRRIQKDLPDLLVLNAGLGFYGDSINLSSQQQREQLDVDLIAPTEQLLAAARALTDAKRPGTILLVASALAFLPCPGLALYAAAKSHLLSLGQALDLELSPLGIRVLVSCPGQVATNFSSRATTKQNPRKHGHKIASSYAAERIWKQIQEKKGVDLFDARYALFIRLAQLLPRRWVMSALYSSIKARI